MASRHGKHKNELIGFNPDDPRLKERLEALAARLGVTCKKVLETAVAEYLDKHGPGTANGEIGPEDHSRHS